jgi:hypothetical protein
MYVLWPYFVAVAAVVVVAAAAVVVAAAVAFVVAAAAAARLDRNDGLRWSVFIADLLLNYYKDWWR